jgi:uncharacterized linocin/CFP29 family protein
MEDANVFGFDEFMGQGGSVAARLLSNNLNLASLRTYALLRKDEWELLDTAAIQAFELRLTGIEDLRTRGLVKRLPGMGVLVSQWNRVSQMNEAEVSMSASADAEQARLDYDLQQVPIPVIFKEFQLDIRFILAHRNGTGSIETEHAMAAGRVVAEKLEDMLFNGNTTVYGGLPIYGYRTHPSRNTGSGATWATTTNVFTNIHAMASGLYADGSPGPYVLYLHRDQFAESLLLADVNNQISARNLALNNIPNLADIRMSDKMTAGEAVMVSMNPETVDLAIAEDFMPVQWDEKGGLGTHYRAMTVAAPRIKADKEGRSGIFHMTGI